MWKGWDWFPEKETKKIIGNDEFMYVEVPIIVSQWVFLSLSSPVLYPSSWLFPFLLFLSLSLLPPDVKSSVFTKEGPCSLSFPPQPQIFLLNLYPRGKMIPRLIFLSRIFFLFFMNGAIYTLIFTFHTLHVNFYSLIFFSLIHSHLWLKIEKCVWNLKRYIWASPFSIMLATPSHVNYFILSILKWNCYWLVKIIIWHYSIMKKKTENEKCMIIILEF